MCHSTEGGAHAAGAAGSPRSFTGSHCHKSMSIPDVATVGVATDAISFDFEHAVFPQTLDLPFHVVHANTLRLAFLTGQSLPPADLVITLRHLVI